MAEPQPEAPASIHQDRPVGPLLRSRLSQADYFRTVHTACVEAGTSEAQLVDPAFWKHVSNQLRPNDRIEVYCEAGRFFAEIIVRQAGNNFASVKLLRWHDLGDTVRQVSVPEYEVVYGGGYAKYQVVRIADREVIKDGIETEEQAQNELRDYVKALAR